MGGKTMKMYAATPGEPGKTTQPRQKTRERVHESTETVVYIWQITHLIPLHHSTRHAHIIFALFDDIFFLVAGLCHRIHPSLPFQRSLSQAVRIDIPISRLIPCSFSGSNLFAMSFMLAERACLFAI